VTLPALAGLLAQPEARLRAILLEGRGANGALGAVALARSIPAAYFVASARYLGSEGASTLRDPSYKVNGFDRAVALEWDAVEDAREQQSERDARHLRTLSLRVTAGYLQGAAHARFARVTAPETAAVAVASAPRRALEDAEVMRAALCCPELYSGGTVPLVLDVRREGPVTIEAVSGDRLLSTATYRVLVEVAL